MTDEEALEATQLIEDYCYEHENCSDCIFRYEANNTLYCALNQLKRHGTNIRKNYIRGKKK